MGTVKGYIWGYEKIGTSTDARESVRCSPPAVQGLLATDFLFCRFCPLPILTALPGSYENGRGSQERPAVLDCGVRCGLLLPVSLWKEPYLSENRICSESEPGWKCLVVK